MSNSKLRVAVIINRENMAPLLLWRDLIVPPNIASGGKIDVAYVSVFDKHEDESITKHFVASRGRRGRKDKVTFYDDPISVSDKRNLEGRQQVFHDMRLNAAKEHINDMGLDWSDFE